MTAWKWLAVGVLSSTALAQTPAPTPGSATAEMLSTAMRHVEPQSRPAAAVQPAAAMQPVAAERVVEVEDVPPPKPAASRVTAVTVYTENALVTRKVVVPEGKGLIELVVTPLPPETIRGSLYTEGGDGLRVLSTRFRTRAVKEDTRQSVRAREEAIHGLELDAQRIKKEIQVTQQDLDFLQKLENFTGATMQGLAEKGKLDVEATIKLSAYVMESRARHAEAMVDREQKLGANAEATRFSQRQLQELSAGSRRTDIDAVIVVDKADAPAARVRLNYLVGAATWRPHYRFRAGGEKDPVQLEYLAAIEQQSGEEWSEAQVTLSTAQPAWSATIPDLLPLETTVVEVAEGEGGKAGERDPGSVALDAARPGAGLPGTGPAGDGRQRRQGRRRLPQRGRGPRPGRRTPRRR